jgi:Carboxypeptidase regulatory-like domain
MAGMNNWLICRHARIAVAIACITTIANSSPQQPQTGQISGHVIDVTGATIKGASVFVRRNIPSEENVRLLTHTDTHGDFKLVLPAGAYDVLIVSPGFAANVETVPVWARQTKKFQWKLKALDCSLPGINCDTVSYF